MTINQRLTDYRKICGKKIIIVEGPAGSGKSTLVNRLAVFPETAIVRGSLGKRSFQVLEAGAKSFINDTNKLQQALLADESVVFVDRCMVSQMVYHAIRTDREVIDPETLSRRTNNLVRALERDLAWRLGREPRQIEIYWMFLVPRAGILRKRREERGKDYPNSAANEIHHYTKVSNQMSLNADLVIKPRLDNLLDADYIVGAFQTYLDHFPYLSFPVLWQCFAGTLRGDNA